MKVLKQKLMQFRKGLTSIDNREPLAPVSLAVIIFLDLFVLSMIFSGLSSHTDQLTSPEEYMPQIAQNVLIQKDWTDIDRIAQLQQLVLIDYNNYSFTAEKFLDPEKIQKMHPKSRELFEAIQAIESDAKLKNAFIVRQENVRALHQNMRDFQQVEPIYGTHLLERKSERLNDPRALVSVEEHAKVRSADYEKIHRALTLLDSQINQHVLVQSLWKVIAPDDSPRRSVLVRDLKRFELKYKFIELFWQMLFLLPILIAMYVWHSKSVKASKSIQTLIASHLLVVATIPVVGKLLEVILDLIPRYFFKKLFELLDRLHIVAFWHYFVIIASVSAAMLLIYFIQKKIFNPDKIHMQRLERGQCFSCVRKIPITSKSCPFCGSHLLIACSNCKQETFVAGKYCTHCAHPTKTA